MKNNILAIDSSGLVASVAVLSDDVLVGEFTIHNKKTHSQTLLPMIDQLLTMAEVDKHELTAIAVAAGPGSFTGLRIGAATAKGLAQVLDIPIIPVSTLQGLAYNMHGGSDLVCPIMDARRSQCYFCIYDVIGETPVPLCDEGAEPIDDIVDRLLAMKRQVVFLGDGVPVYKDRILDRYHEWLATAADEGDVHVVNTAGWITFADDAKRYQLASSVAALGRVLYRDFAAVPAADFTPVYLRKSQAEREREETENKNLQK